MKAFALQLRAEDGQVIVFVIAILTILIGMGALVIDGGSWFRAQRHLQTSADAAALAGAQDLPFAATAQSTAITYAQTNYTGLPAPTVTFPATAPTCATNTCIDVAARDHGAGLSRQDLRRGLQQRHDHRARAGRNLRSLDAEERRADRGQERSRVRGHESGLLRPEGDLQLRREQRVLEHDRADQPHLPLDSFDCLRLVRRHRRQPAEGLDRKRLRRRSSRQPVVRRQDGRDGRPVKQGLNDKIGTPLFFPVFDTTANSGPNYFFHIIGWAAFVIESVDSWGPGGRQLTGHFVTYIASDLAAGDPASGTTDFGVHVISLIQ